MAEPPASMTMFVASNSLNTLVVPKVRLIPKPAHAGGLEQLPEANPSIVLELPDPPQGRICVGVDGQDISEDRFAVHESTVFVEVPPLADAKACGRISYLVDGALQLLTFELRRAETIAALVESLQAQFDNMTAFVDGLEDVASDQHGFFYEHARKIQHRIVNAMELMPTWTPQEYDELHARSGDFSYTKGGA